MTMTEDDRAFIDEGRELAARKLVDTHDEEQMQMFLGLILDKYEELVSAGVAPQEPTREEYRDAYESWKRSGQEAHRALLEIWHMAEPGDTAHLTYGESPVTVVDSVRSLLKRQAESEDHAATVTGALGRELVQRALDNLSALDLNSPTTREGTAWGSYLREAKEHLAAALAAPVAVDEARVLTSEEILALPTGSVIMTETDPETFGVYEQRVWQRFGGVPEWHFGHSRHDWQSTDGGFVRVEDGAIAPGFSWNRKVTLLYTPGLRGGGQ